MAKSFRSRLSTLSGAPRGKGRMQWCVCWCPGGFVVDKELLLEHRDVNIYEDHASFFGRVFPTINHPSSSFIWGFPNEMWSSRFRFSATGSLGKTATSKYVGSFNKFTNVYSIICFFLQNYLWAFFVDCNQICCGCLDECSANKITSSCNST